MTAQTVPITLSTITFMNKTKKLVRGFPLARHGVLMRRSHVLRRKQRDGLALGGTAWTGRWYSQPF
jgi:hypothetical protein